MKIREAILAIAIVAPGIALAQKVEMKLNLEKGRKYIQHIESEVVNKSTQMGQVQEMTQSANAKISVELSDEMDGADKYSISYDEIDMAVTSMMGTQSFSSDTSSLETVDQMSKLLASLSGKPFQATISDKGIVKEVFGLEEIISASTAGMPGGQPMIDQLSGSFGDDGFAKNIEMTTDIFPDNKVKVGDSWTKEQFTAMGIPIISNSVYTLESVDGGTAIISIKAKLTSDPNNATMDMMGMEATQYFEGDRSGSFKVDVASGWVLSADIKDDVVGSITLAPNAQLPDGMTVPVELKSKTTIKN